jgi:hypothetical protein
MKHFLKGMPILGPLAVKVLRKIKGYQSFIGSNQYWEGRYATGGNSGSGSYGRLALYKAELINKFVVDNKIASVIEFGCGDGHQLSLANYPQYAGLDVSLSAITLCKSKFNNDRSKEFILYANPFLIKPDMVKELSLSLDVIYHLVEDNVFENYMFDLFESASRFVIIYASNVEGEQRFHERTRNFTKWISQNIKNWTLQEEILNRYPYDLSDPDNTSQSNFYIYRLTEN